MDILRDWQFWGVVVGILAIISGFAIYLLQRNKKRLVYSILTETPLLSVDEEIKGKIKIKYGRKNIQNIFLVVLKIENTGNVDIASSDYESPIIFSFEDSEILSAEITDVSPKNLKPTIDNGLLKLIIEPVLLNKKDYIVCKLLFSKYMKKIDVDTRIIGVKEVERVKKENLSLRDKLLTLGAYLFMMTVLFSTIFYFFQRGFNVAELMFLSVSVLLAMSLLVFLLFYSIDRK